MGLKFLYYIDTSANWILFTLGIICVPFGVGGLILTTPILQKNVFPPWFHGTGIWVGMVFLSIAIMMPFARFNTTFLRLAVALNFVAMMIASVGLGVSIDEFINWFENPTVKTFGSDTVPTDNEVYVSPSAQTVVDNFREFDIFHKGRVIIVMGATLLGICMMLFRIVTLGLVLFDEFTTRGYDVYTPEEEMMHQAMEDRDNVANNADDEDDPLLYAGGRSDSKMTKLYPLREDDLDDDSYYEKIKAIHDLSRTYEDKFDSIYDPNVFATTKMKDRPLLLPTYNDSEESISEKKSEVNLNNDYGMSLKYRPRIVDDKEPLILSRKDDMNEM